MTPAEEAVSRLYALFGEPNTPDPQNYVKEYAKALTGYDARCLHAAIDRVMRHAKFWPRPAEVLEHAREVAADLYAANKAAEHKPIERREEPSAEQKARVQALLSAVLTKIKAEPIEESVTPDFSAGTKPQFEETQATSRNAHLHRPGSLSPTSRRMSGDRDE